ncbi:MAG: enoyl-CoA hydratase/isomerase family protein [Pseudomonadales bacterium]
MSETTEFTSITYTVDEAVACIGLNRQDKLNAIDRVMIGQLHQALDVVAADPQIRVVLLHGEGKCFSSGFDLTSGEQVATTDSVYWRKELRADFDIIMRFWDFPKPTVAAVHKYCLGGAMEMALACDLTIANDGCRFGAPEVKFGSGIVAMILPWLTGAKAAKEFLLTGDDTISAERFLNLGLLNRVVESEQLLAESKSMARIIASNDQLAVTLTKQAINRSYEAMGMRQALLQGLELDVLIETGETPESKAFNKIMQEEGVKTALAWRAKQLEHSQ